jgi:hypothetical protein
MLHVTLVVLLTAIAWVVLGSVLFFNPLVDPVYQEMYAHPDKYPQARSVPKSPRTLALILAINVLKCSCYAAVYLLVQSALPAEPLRRGLLFGLMLTLTRMIPGDVDRAFLTTYPAKAAWIEFAIFTIGVFVIAMSYSCFL